MRSVSWLILLSVVLTAAVAVAEADDPYLWLEEVDGEKALEWVKARSDKDVAEIESEPDFHAHPDQAAGNLQFQ